MGLEFVGFGAQGCAGGNMVLGCFGGTMYDNCWGLRIRMEVAIVAKVLIRMLQKTYVVYADP